MEVILHVYEFEQICLHKLEKEGVHCIITREDKSLQVDEASVFFIYCSSVMFYSVFLVIQKERNRVVVGGLMRRIYKAATLLKMAEILVPLLISGNIFLVEAGSPQCIYIFGELSFPSLVSASPPPHMVGWLVDLYIMPNSDLVFVQSLLG